MPSSRKIAANRTNARRSTGPRTATGRLRASLNALKHGLAVPASAHPEFQHDIDQLARVLAGEAQDDPIVMVRALRVAEAAIEVQRARRARHELLRRWDLTSGVPRVIKPPETPPDPRPARERLAHLAHEKSREALIRALERSMKRLSRMVKPLPPRDDSRQEAARNAAWDDLLHQLGRLDRYERRARSRRDRAIKEFDFAKTKAMSI